MNSMRWKPISIVKCMSIWQFMTTQGQCHSLTFVQGHSDSTFSNLLSSETARTIEAKFHMEPPYGERKTCSSIPGHMTMPIYGKNFKRQGQICFLMFLHGWKLIKHWLLMYFLVCSNLAYPQQSGERYRTIGPLVHFYCIFFFLYKIPVSRQCRLS